MKKIITFLISGIITLLIAVIVTFLYSRPWKNALFITPVYKIETNHKLVAITFDDGPSQTRTPILLDLLKKYNVKATFFMLGKNIEKYPDIARNVYRHGHLIGNHSYNHPRMIFKSPAFIKEQIMKTDELIESIGQKEIEYFRPPHSAKYFMLPLVLRSMHKNLVTGTYDPPSEYIKPYNGLKVTQEVIANTKPGSIIYLHDGIDGDQEQFIKSIEQIITGLKKKGYQFITLDYMKPATTSAEGSLHNDIFPD